MLSNGLHPGLTRQEYDRLTRVNFSSLKYMARSPAHYRHNLLNGTKDSTAKKVGRVTHVSVFEPERFRAEVAVWDGGRRQGKEWEAFKEAHRDREILTEDEHAECLALATAVRTDMRAAHYLSGGRGEVSALWTDAALGTECKARLDFVANCGALVDLKTTRSAHPDDFSREAARFAYHVQAAFYSDAYEAVTGERVPYVLVTVEKEAPYTVQVYRVPEELLAVGRNEYRGWLGMLADCRRDSVWPGYAAGELDLCLPRWAVPAEENGEDDFSGLDLLIGGETHGL